MRKLAPFPEPPQQAEANGAQPTDFALPQHITQPLADAAAPLANGAAIPIDRDAAADAAHQQGTSPSVWAKIIEGLGPDEIAAAAATASVAGAARPVPAANGTAHPAEASGAATDSAGDLAAAPATDSCAAALQPQPSDMACDPVPPGMEPGAVYTQASPPQPQQTGDQAEADGLDAAAPMEVDAIPPPAPAAAGPAGDVVAAASADLSALPLSN